MRICDPESGVVPSGRRVCEDVDRVVPSCWKIHDNDGTVVHGLVPRTGQRGRGAKVETTATRQARKLGGLRFKSYKHKFIPLHKDALAGEMEVTNARIREDGVFLNAPVPETHVAETIVPEQVQDLTRNEECTDGNESSTSSMDVDVEIELEK